MKTISEKDNLMLFMRGEQPHWVPRFGMGPADPYAKYPSAIAGVRMNFMEGHRSPEGGTDIWGVEYVTTEETAGATIPKPGKFILDDIRKWRDVIKAPDLSHVDWDKFAREELAKINRDESAIVVGLHVGYFQTLMAFMGFNEGLCAMYEEPEEVKALFTYMADFYVPIMEKMVEYIKPDIIDLTDDTATAINPFVSVEMYRELIKPFHYAQCKPAIDNGIPVMMHNCGRCEDQIDDWFDCGVTAWNPAQLMNDLDGIKKKYGNKLGLCGCWDSSGPVSQHDATEELVRESVRATIDRFAPGGGFCFWGSTYGPVGDTAVENRKRWITEEYESYRYFYGK